MTKKQYKMNFLEGNLNSSSEEELNESPRKPSRSDQLESDCKKTVEAFGGMQKAFAAYNVMRLKSSISMNDPIAKF